MSTYVSLTNELLRRLNEVPLDAAGDGFDTVRNVQAAAKDAINSSLREVYQVGMEWPFLKTTYTQTLSAGTNEYVFPSDFSRVDWETFYIKGLSSENNAPQLLRVISYEEYLKSYRPQDDTDRQAVPALVYQTFGDSFGVTPTPNASYEVEYVYWRSPLTLTNYSDVCIVPERFNHVIIDGAMAYMMTFRSNDQSAAMHDQKFEQGIRHMKRILFDDELRLRSIVVERR
tara:strand:+ start:149 stop:835 length:687 start_codon:yes stop_codon:yes gene_type:complete